jgi:peptide deformylase
VRVLGRPVDSHPSVPPEARRGTVRRITEVGEGVLDRTCRPVAPEEFGGAELATLIDDMFATMYIADGAGLAANQVGVGLRLFVYDCWDEQRVRHVGHLVNPVLDEPDPGERRLIEDTEGCLSVPGASITVPRAERAVARGFDKDGEPLVIEGEGYFARCLQHETDHLDGRLYLTRLSKRDRKTVLRESAESRDAVFAKRDRKAATLAS